MTITPLWGLHADGSNCFHRLTSIGLADTLSADNASLTFTFAEGQVVAFAENSAIPLSAQHSQPNFEIAGSVISARPANPAQSSPH